MTCASCQHHVEEALRSTAGVQSAHVDLMAHRASVVFDPAVAAPAAHGRGHSRRRLRRRASPPRCFAAPEASSNPDASESESLRPLAAGAIAMLLAMPLGNRNGRAGPRPHAPFALALCAAAGPVALVPADSHGGDVAWAGRGIYLSAIRALRHGTTNMNTLVSLGTGVAFRVLRLCHHLARNGRQVYFDAVLLILGFLLLGKAWKPAPSAAPWPRSTRSPGCARHRPPHSRRRGSHRVPSPRFRSATAFWSCPASASRWTRPFSKAAPPWTSRCSPANPRRCRASPAAAFWPARSTTTAPSPAGRNRWARPRCWRRSRAWSSRRSPRARPWSGWPTAPVPSLFPSCWLWRRSRLLLAHRRAFASAGPGQHRRRAGGCLPLRHGIGRSRRAHRGRGPRRATRCALQGRRGSGTPGAPGRNRPRQDRNAHRGPAVLESVHPFAGHT
jgi:hypothetical protein